MIRPDPTAGFRKDRLLWQKVAGWNDQDVSLLDTLTMALGNASSRAMIVLAAETLHFWADLGQPEARQ